MTSPMYARDYADTRLFSDAESQAMQRDATAMLSRVTHYVHATCECLTGKVKCECQRPYGCPGKFCWRHRAHDYFATEVCSLQWKEGQAVAAGMTGRGQWFITPADPDVFLCELEELVA